VTEKQIERVRTKITRVKRELAADKKRWGGYYDDSAGLRYVAPDLYLKIRDFKGAMNYFRWFAKNFPDDCCYGEFLLEWSLTLFKLGKVEDARQKVTDAYFIDTRVLNKFLGRQVTMVDETINSFERDWSETQVLGYSAKENDWADFAVWLETLLTSEPFLSLSKEYLEIQNQLKTESDPAKRGKLREMEEALNKKLRVW
jgi:hypothetical protein